MLKEKYSTEERSEKFIEKGYESVLERHPSSQTYTKKVDGDLEAKIVTLFLANHQKVFPNGQK